MNHTSADGRILHETTRTTPQARRELEQAVGIAVESFARCFRELFPRIEDELFTAAQEEVDRTRQSRILDAYGLVRANRAHIESQFRRAIESIAQRRLHPETARATAAARSAINLDALSLLDDNQVEADMVVQRMVKRLRDTPSSGPNEIADLDDRLGYLLGREHVDDEESPLSPEALCRAIQRACEQLDAENEVRIEVLRGIEGLLNSGFMPAYREVNTHLSAVNVLPDLAAWRRQRYSVKRTTGSATLRTTPQAARVDTHQEIAPLTPTETQAATQMRHADLVDRLSRLRAMQPQSVDAPSLSESPDTFWPTLPSSALDQLPQLVPAMPALGTSDASLLAAMPLAELNVLHHVRDSARTAGVARDEEILIDLVAMVVDKILADEQVPDRIKRLIVRLQVPLLRAALLDRTLFATPEHPARVLLDTIARSAVGWQDDDSDAEVRYHALVFDIVTTVENEFDRDLELFERQTQRLDEFLKEQEGIQAARYARAAELLHQAEQREIADMQALEQIRDAVGEIELPEELTDFLLDPWRRVLVEATVTGAIAEHVSELRYVMTDLVWSVQPKITKDERDRLVAMLPLLLKKIRLGLSTITLAAHEQQRFFNGLMNAHSAAVKIGVRSELQDRAFARFENRVNDLRIDPLAAPSDLHVPVSTEMVEQLAQQHAVPIQVAAQPSQDSMQHAVCAASDIDRIVANLKRGTWAELTDRDPRRVARLRWISPRRSTYLFTDRSGTEAVSYTPELLRLHIEIGYLVVFDDKDLTERALDSVEAALSN
ncbi:MAG TPA: DUF1631 family protein [Burkholderiaceae bacterium]|nr:DUF1631 family protein [Burkholderiaceae bacterium]